MLRGNSDDNDHNDDPDHAQIDCLKGMRGIITNDGAGNVFCRAVLSSTPIAPGTDIMVLAPGIRLKRPAAFCVSRLVPISEFN